LKLEEVPKVQSFEFYPGSDVRDSSPVRVLHGVLKTHSIRSGSENLDPELPVLTLGSRYLHNTSFYLSHVLPFLF
jgi:hypothetical protein